MLGFAVGESLNFAVGCEESRSVELSGLAWAGGHLGVERSWCCCGECVVWFAVVVLSDSS